MSASMQLFDRDAPLFTVGVAAKLAGMHPQTLRGYDRLGLVVPQRSKGRGRRYSLRDVGRLRLIQQLSQGEGINLNGIKRIIELQDQLEDLSLQVSQLTDLLEAASWRPQRGRVFKADASGDIWLGPRSRYAGSEQALTAG